MRRCLHRRTRGRLITATRHCRSDDSSIVFPAESQGLDGGPRNSGAAQDSHKRLEPPLYRTFTNVIMEPGRAAAGRLESARSLPVTGGCRYIPRHFPLSVRGRMVTKINFRWTSRALVFALMAALIGCGGAPTRRINPPGASIQVLNTASGDEWRIELRVQNFSARRTYRSAIGSGYSRAIRRGGERSPQTQRGRTRRRGAGAQSVAKPYLQPGRFDRGDRAGQGISVQLRQSVDPGAGRCRRFPLIRRHLQASRSSP
jgi:hypothetical protein